MGDRSYHKRCLERLERLRRRVAHLTERIDRTADIDLRYDKAERSALRWAIEEIERWDVVTDIVLSRDAADDKLARIESLLRSRLLPSANDLARTPGLARQRAERQDRFIGIARDWCQKRQAQGIGPFTDSDVEFLAREFGAFLSDYQEQRRIQMQALKAQVSSEADASA